MLCGNPLELWLGEWQVIDVEELSGVAHVLEQTEMVAEDGARRLFANGVSVVARLARYAFRSTAISKRHLEWLP